MNNSIIIIHKVGGCVTIIPDLGGKKSIPFKYFRLQVKSEKQTNRNNIFSIDFLKIDTEGFDYFVLKGVPWDKLKPRLILCEFEDRKTKRLGYTFNEMANFLLDKGYKVVVSEWYPIEEYGKSHKWRNMKDYPCKLDDQILGHGNILAFADSNDYRKLNYIIKR